MLDPATSDQLGDAGPRHQWPTIGDAGPRHQWPTIGDSGPHHLLTCVHHDLGIIGQLVF